MHYGYSSSSLTRDGRPWTPVMGEMHYSRVPAGEWARSLELMKAGGIDIVSSYVIWIHHEEIAGEVRFDGDLDLRRFVEAVRDAGMLCWLRIGPWVHGEVRNGGLPDWMLRQDFAVRTNDERYFAQVKRFYRLVAEQVDGLFEPQGGPIVGVQIENEYGHCGGLDGPAGEEHMRRLYELARATGFDVPYFSATGWGGACTGGLLPLMGGYAEAPWDPRLTPIEPSGNFVITPERNDHNVGSDLGVGAGLTFDPSRFPYLTAELGGGLQVTEHRRPVARPDDVGAMGVAKLASGASMLGYYMYHGGLNPDGRRSTLQESRETGYPNDLPVKSYDFRAPLGAYGQITPTWHEVRLLALFLHDFGADLAGMQTVFPPDNPSDPADASHLRHSMRHNGKWGYVCVNNYTRQATRPAFRDVHLTALGRELPAFDVPADAYGIYPVDMPVHGGVVRFAQATPLCRAGDTTVFYGEWLDASDGADVRLISRADARRAYLVDGSLVLSDDPIVAGRRLVERPADDLRVQTLAQGPGRWLIRLSGYDRGADDYALRLHYRADTLRVLVDGRLVDDDFWADGVHYLGLRRYGYPSELVVECDPLRADAPVYLERWPRLDAGVACALDAVNATRLDWVGV